MQVTGGRGDTPILAVGTSRVLRLDIQPVAGAHKGLRWRRAPPSLARMKRLSLGSQVLVTGNRVADALASYVPMVERMRGSVTVTVPALEDNGAIVAHTLLIGRSNDLEITDIDGGDPALESRFEVPRFPAVGGRARAADTSEIDIISTPIPD